MEREKLVKEVKLKRQVDKKKKENEEEEIMRQKRKVEFLINQKEFTQMDE